MEPRNPLLLLLAVVFVSACGVTATEADPVDEPIAQGRPEVIRIPVETVTVRLEDVTETLELTGTVQEWDDFAISSEIAGRVSRIHVDEGDWVKAGDLLLELERKKRELELRSRQAHLRRAEVELEYAKKRLARGEALLEKGAISQSEVDTLEERVGLASSTVEVARVDIERIEEELEDTAIFSPADGRISVRLVSLGETVSPRTPLITVIQLNPVKVVTEITEPYLSEIGPGWIAQMRFDAFPDREVTGRVHRVHPSATSESGAFPIEIKLPNLGREFQPGMISRVTLRGKTFDNALLVPLESILNAEGKDFVFVVEGDVARRREVRVQERVGGWAVVEAELRAGQEVVVQGNSNLTDGTTVEIVT
jgi:RND family efflux transporter MFP subunit